MTSSHKPTTETTVGELVAQRPGRSRIFESLGIDYCCGGKRRLSEACLSKGLDADFVLATLLATQRGGTSDQRSWASASLTELADHIEQTHHEFLKGELPRLATLVHKVAAVHGDRHPWMHAFEEEYDRFAAELGSHMNKEEQTIFPLIRRLERGESATTIDRGQAVEDSFDALELEHEDAGRSLARLHELSDGLTPPADACNTFRAMLDGVRELEVDLHEHVHEENNILFPKALELSRRLAREKEEEMPRAKVI
jgi:regulator of cell morphogenesis and NO signaling